MISAAFFLLIVLEVKGDCLEGKCQRISLDVYQDGVQDSEFVGHVFRNFTTVNLIQCYMKCIQDCRCLSLNYKENSDQNYCELNEGNHFTKNISLKHSPGSRFYILRRDYGSEVMWNSLLGFCIKVKTLIFLCYPIFSNLVRLKDTWTLLRNMYRIAAIRSRNKYLG